MVVHSSLRVVSLFSGIGGLDLGVHAGLAYLGYAAVPVCYVEREVFAAGVLAARMADGALAAAPVWGDVTTFPEEQFAGRADMVIGGFPCQDISNAGRRAGIIPGNRSGLWFEFLRIIRVVRPRYVFIENVAALLGRGLDVVLGTLAEVGFDAEWTTVRASDTGAPHQRERVFILAVAVGHCEGPERLRKTGGYAQPAERHGPLDGGPTLADPRGRLVSAAGRRAAGRDGTGPAGAEFLRGGVGLADAQESGLEEHGRRGGDGTRLAGFERDSLPLYPPGPGDTAAWAAVLRQWPDLAPALSINEEWDYGLQHPLAAPPSQSALRGLADGNRARMERPGSSTRAGQLRALGNGVVPAAATVAFVELWRRVHGELC